MHHHLVRGHNKVSHVDTDVVTKVITAIEAHFEKVTVTRGKEYVFLGMNIVYYAPTFQNRLSKTNSN